MTNENEHEIGTDFDGQIFRIKVLGAAVMLATDGAMIT